MQQVTLYKAINKESKLYGLKLIGIIIAGISAMLTWAVCNETAAVFACAGGYAFGNYLSSLWHSGYLQRLCYWYLPIAQVFGNKYLTPSHLRKFM